MDVTLMTTFHLRRLLISLLAVTLLTAVLAIRLAYLQLVAAENYSRHHINLVQQAVQQRQEELILNSGRGAITDRDGKALTGEIRYVLVLFPIARRTAGDEDLAQAARLLNLSLDHLKEVRDRLKEPTIYHQGGKMVFLEEREAEEINRLNIPGILGVPYELRYPVQERLASHLIGHVGQNPDWVTTRFAEEVAQGILDQNSVVGISGLELTFQPFLQGVGPTSLAYYVDGKGNLLRGLGLKYLAHDHQFYPLTVRTTLDAHLQRRVEEILDHHQVEEGAVVLLDSHNSHIVAMASRPEPTEDRFDSPSWENKALKRYAPGSIFKVVVAAAALEEGLVRMEDTFHCPGSLPGTPFTCWKKEGHGYLTFAQAFYHSCNIVFGELATKLGAERLEEYGYQLGVLQLNGWHAEALFHLEDFHQLDREEAGQLFDGRRSPLEREDSQFLRQTGIGQLDVQLSPLAVANMMATISRGGIPYQVKAVEAIHYQTGGTFYRFNDQPLDGAPLSPYTVYQLRQLLQGVVTKGTGQPLKEAPLSVAGKTGTAQVGWDDKLELRWFAGYADVENPRYAFSVVILNQQAHESNLAIQVVKDLLEELGDS